MKPKKTKSTWAPSSLQATPEESFRTSVEIDSLRHGEYIVTVEVGAEAEALQILENVTGMSGMLSTGLMSANEIADEALSDGPHGIFLSRLGIAMVSLDPEQFKALSKQGGPTILGVEPAPVFFTISGLTADYLRGYRDCADALLRTLDPKRTSSSPDEDGTSVLSNLTWGLQITKVGQSQFMGRGIRLAILDTGLDLHHPDFVGRQCVHRSFISGETAQDRNSHGTHCAGTACGPANPMFPPRYGVAPEADLYVGKVLSDGGSSRGRSVELGMEWALANRCQVISMSLGSAVLPGAPHSIAYERIGSRALRAGSLIIAAAGNDSARRRGIINPVSSPANCPSILSVGSVDSGLNIADFSNGGINTGGGELNIVAPGVEVHSAVPGGQYGLKNGTSMAVPHVAGIAALWAEATGKRGQDLWNILLSKARPLPHDTRDVGTGLVQAPTC